MGLSFEGQGLNFSGMYATIQDKTRGVMQTGEDCPQ